MEGVTDKYSDDEEDDEGVEDDELGERDENDDLLDGESLEDAMEMLSQTSGSAPSSIHK